MPYIQHVRIPESSPFFTAVVGAQGKKAQRLGIPKKFWHDFPLGTKVMVIKVSEGHPILARLNKTVEVTAT